MIIRRRLALVVSDDLPEQEKQTIQTHLAACPACQRRLTSLERAYDATVSCDSAQADPFVPLWPSLRARLEHVEATTALRRFGLPFGALAAASVAIAAMWWSSRPMQLSPEAFLPRSSSAVSVTSQSGPEWDRANSLDPELVFGLDRQEPNRAPNPHFHLERARPVSHSRGDF